MRVLGKPAGIFVLLVDALKGYAACALLAPLIFNWFAPHASGLIRYFHDEPVELQIRFYVIAGFFAVLGHNYTCWLEIQGRQRHCHQRRGLSARSRRWPWASRWRVWMIGVCADPVRFGRRPSRRRWRLPAAVWILPPHNLLLGIVTTALGVLAIYKHKGNIQRLLPEPKAAFGKKTANPEATK